MKKGFCLICKFNAGGRECSKRLKIDERSVTKGKYTDCPSYEGYKQEQEKEFELDYPEWFLKKVGV